MTPPAAPSNGRTADGRPAAPASAPTGGRLARMIVVLCFVITFLATALIYWRWANVTEPSSYVIVQGTEEHNGTVVVVRPNHQPDVVAMATLSPQNEFSATIFLRPGTYTFTATQNGETLIHGEMLVAHRRWRTILLRTRRSATSDTSPRPGVSS